MSYALFILFYTQINVSCFQSVLSEMNWMAWYLLLCPAHVWKVLIEGAMVFEITVTEQKDPEIRTHLALGFTVYTIDSGIQFVCSEVLLIPEASV